MDNRRFFAFIVFSFGFLWVWTTFVQPKFFPLPKPVPADVVRDKAADADNDPQNQDADVGNVAADEVAEKPDATAESDVPQPDAAADVAAADNDGQAEPELYPRKTLELGSLDPASGYFLKVLLSSAGAVVEDVQLTDPKFRDLRHQDEQVTVIGSNSSPSRTFSLAVAVVDEQLQRWNMSLETADWEVVESSADSATFAFVAPDKALRLEKTYRLPRIEGSPETLKGQYRTNAEGYTIEVELLVQNLAELPQPVAYDLLGPVGILMENAEHSRKYRDIKIEFLGDDKDATLAASTLQDQYDEYRETAAESGTALTDAEITPLLKEGALSWTGAFRYAGVDVQFFAALVSPIDDRPVQQRIDDKWIERTYPVLVQEDRRRPELSDLSFRMASTEYVLSPVGTPEDTLVHRYALFVGPKYREVLDSPPFEAEAVLDYGSWFGFIARGMHTVLNFLHNAGLPYFMAIICLTIMVRGCLFPLSRKQAISAAKMKDLQPKINELKLKYGDDKEKMAKAQMELWRKHKINPLGGCLPLFLQFPVFIGLYTCLNTAVDLRLAPFLWINNLAAPDALFRLPFSLPFLGQDFNLLPCITVVLFLMQQKMFMPPPADEQQEAQQKMMNVMTLFFGVMFWHVPAGLCIYFIASSLWGIAERKLLGNTSTSTTADSDDVVDEQDQTGPPPSDHSKKRSVAKSGRKNGTSQNPAKPEKTGFMQRLMDAAEQAQKQAEKNRAAGTRGGKKKKR